MNAIGINEPCQENWNKMNPTQQGAFCSTCEIDVVDFSRLSIPQVKSVLKENTGKHMCGRFESGQLETLNKEFEDWKNNQPRAFQSRFVYALLLVFGLSLFSCSEEDAKQIAGFSAIELQAALLEPDKAVSDQLFFHMDAIIADEMIPPAVYINESHIHGDVQMTIEQGVWLEEMQATAVDRDAVYLGGVGSTIEYDEYMAQAQDSAETTLPEEILNVYSPFETKIYPNPTRDFSNLSIYVQQPAQFTVEMYSISGQRVLEIHNGELQDGRHNFEIDLTEYVTGTYIVKVWSAEQDETIKILKVD